MSHRRTTILFTEDSLPVGGAERVLLQRLQHLDRAAFDVHLLTLRRQGLLLADARERADHYACVERRLGLDARALVRLRRYIRCHGVDLVQTNQWLDALYVLLATRGMAVKRVATVHGYEPTWRSVVNLRVLRSFDRVVCVSRAEALDLFKLGLPWTSLAVVPNSCDPSFHAQAERDMGRAAGAPFRMVMVGHFRRARDPETLIGAVGALHGKGRNVTLHLVGDGDPGLRAACMKLVAARGLERVVTFDGDAMVGPELLTGFDLFVFASLADTFGVAILEAMACGLPVLVSDIPAFMELIGHGRFGAHFEAGNAASCAAAIEQLMQSAERRCALGVRGAERAQDFRVEKTTATLEAVYHDVLGGA